MADNKPTSWEYSKNSPIDNYGTIINGGSAITTITPTNPTGYLQLDPDSNDGIVSRIFYSIDINGKVTYAEGNINGELRTRPDGTPIKQFNNIQEIARAGFPGYDDNTTLRLKDALSKNLKGRYKAIVIDNEDGASPYAKSGPNQPNTDGVSINLEDLPNQITGDNLRNWSDDENPYYYPEGIRNSEQDYIQFDILDYKTKRPDASKGNLAFQEREQTTTVLKTIILPIQPSISDSNSVDWNSGQINPVELAAVGLSGQLMNLTSKERIDETLKNLVDKGIISNENAQKAIRLYLQQKAVGVSGLLSRFGGAVLNPNMELLFQGPQLRPFTFSFRLSPREKSEAKMVKKIIRAFKESMCVKTTSQQLFLAAPNVYNIKYVNRYKDKNEDHPSLNKIKMCALKSCNVDYTPDGSYMTFNEPNATMASYNLTLQFQELEPVTSKDYDKNYDHIGY